jgi:hypothetical protein
MRDGATATYVADLLNAEGRSWNEAILNQNLLPFDAEAAKQIPLGRIQEDFWAWSGERHGLYTVRSAYRLLADVEAQGRSHRLNRAKHSGANRDPRWMKLWRQRVPPKVRVFWWKVMNDFIPCRANLNRKHIDPIAKCEACGAPKETTFHTLVECNFARVFWRKLRAMTGIKLPRLCPTTWTDDLLSDAWCREGERIVILCGMWSL